MDQFLDVEILKQIDYGSKLDNASRKSPGSTPSPSQLERMSSSAQNSQFSRKLSEEDDQCLTPTREHHGTKTRRLENEIEPVKISKVSTGTWVWDICSCFFNF